MRLEWYEIEVHESAAAEIETPRAFDKQQVIMA
jgi:hypothetical protein